MMALISNAKQGMSEGKSSPVVTRLIRLAGTALYCEDCIAVLYGAHTCMYTIIEIRLL